MFSDWLPPAAGHQVMALVVTIPTTAVGHYTFLILLIRIRIFIHTTQSPARGGLPINERRGEEQQSQAENLVNEL